MCEEGRTYPVEARADVVAVQAVDVLPMLQNKLFLEGLGDGTLPATRKARHPQRDALLPHRRITLLSWEVAGFLRPAFARSGTFNDVRRRQRQPLGAHLPQVKVGQVHRGALHILSPRKDVNDGQKHRPMDGWMVGRGRPWW